MKTLLAGLDELGFGDLGDIDALKTEDAYGGEAEVKITTTYISHDEYVYDKSYDCPVCEKKFKEKTIKTSKLRFQALDIDLMPKYTPIYPFYYSVVLCPFCGYASHMDNFGRITEAQEGLIKNQITPKYKRKEYSFPFSEETAIERYKFALLNSVVKKGKLHERAYICLVISWLYKIQEDEENRMLFAKNAYDAFAGAYGNESFPFFGMNEIVTSYLLGELARYTGDYDNAMKWTSRVLTSRMATSKIKEMALDLKNRITKQPKNS